MELSSTTISLAVTVCHAFLMKNKRRLLVLSAASEVHSSTLEEKKYNISHSCSIYVIWLHSYTFTVKNDENKLFSTMSITEIFDCYNY